jgi:hypothetical protein
MFCISQNYLCLKLNKYVIKSGNNVRATLWSVLHQSDHRKIKSSQYLGGGGGGEPPPKGGSHDGRALERRSSMTARRWVHDWSSLRRWLIGTVIRILWGDALCAACDGTARALPHDRRILKGSERWTRTRLEPEPGQDTACAPNHVEFSEHLATGKLLGCLISRAWSIWCK